MLEQIVELTDGSTDAPRSASELDLQGVKRKLWFVHNDLGNWPTERGSFENKAHKANDTSS